MRDSFRNPKAKAAAVLVAVFLLGGGTGYFAGYWHAMGGPGWGGWRGQAPAPRGEDRTAHFLRKLESDLGLSGAQSKQAEDILRRHHQRFIELRREMAPKIDGILKEVRADLRAMLGPGQREHFDRMVRMMEEHRQRRRERWWRGMGGMMRESPGPPGESR